MLADWRSTRRLLYISSDFDGASSACHLHAAIAMQAVNIPGAIVCLDEAPRPDGADLSHSTANMLASRSEM